MYTLWTSDCVSVLSGLFVGKEGPMIHSGAIVGAGLPQVHRHMSTPTSTTSLAAYDEITILKCCVRIQ